MKTFEIPVNITYFDTIKVEAKSMEDAIDRVLSTNAHELLQQTKQNVIKIKPKHSENIPKALTKEQQIKYLVLKQSGQDEEAVQYLASLLFDEFDKIVREQAIFRNDVWVVQKYWGYDDDLTSTLNTVFDKPLSALKNEPLENHICNVLYEDCINSLEDLDAFYFINELSKTSHMAHLLDIDDVRYALEDYFYQCYDTDLNLSEVLNRSEPEDLVLYFGTNWDDDYMVHTVWSTVVNQDEELTPELIEEANNTPLGWLIKTQGYTPQDLRNAKETNSEFLKTVYEEIDHYISDLSGTQLIAIPYSTDWHAIFDLKTKKTGVVKAGTCFGLFNKIHGSGSGLNIPIEKDIILNNDSILYDVEVTYCEKAYCYSPDAVYGHFDRGHYQQLERI